MAHIVYYILEVGQAYPIYWPNCISTTNTMHDILIFELHFFLKGK